MNVHLSFKSGKTPDVEREFQTHIQKLSRRLRAFKPDLVHLHAVVDNAARQELSTSLNLRLPSGQMAATSTSSTASASVKAAFTDLLAQLTKHKDLLRGMLDASCAGAIAASALQRLCLLKRPLPLSRQ